MYPKYDLLQYPTAAAQRGNSILLLGISGDGPVNVPVAASSPDKVMSIFGVRGNLYRAYLEAYRTNPNAVIYLMRITGDHAMAELTGETEDFGPLGTVMKLKAVYGGAHYNNIQGVIKDIDGSGSMSLVFTFPPETGLAPLSYDLNALENINMLTKVINDDTRAGRSCLYAATKYPAVPATELIPLNSSFQLSGGVDGLTVTKNDLFIALEYSYKLLGGYPVDIVIPVEAYFDDADPVAFYGEEEYGNIPYIASRDYLTLQDTEQADKFVTFHGQLIDFCKSQMNMGIMTHGVIGLNPVANPAQLEEYEFSYIIKLLEASAFRNRYDLSAFSNGNWIDSGYYVSVVGGEFIHNEGTVNEYFSNFAIMYAAMLTMIGAGTTTNMAIPNAPTLRYHFTTDEITELSRIGVVVPRESVRKGLVVSYGITAAQSTSDMASIANVRQAQLALGSLNDALEQFNGEQLLPLINAGTIEEVTESTLNALKNQGILIDYKYVLEYDRNRGLGTLSVDLLTKNMVDYIPARASLSGAT